ncbi:MAG: glycosyltransferase family 9 protein [Alphaproteobacteria bacterium]
MNHLTESHRILVIRLGALGDLTLCAPAFQAIREVHPRADITLLTQPAWVDFTRSMPWFDHIIADVRPNAGQIDAWMGLRRRLRAANIDRVYDLQGKLRQDVLFWLLGGPWSGIGWSGAALGCKFPRPWPPEPSWHFTDFIAAQLKVVGVTVPDYADWSWLDAPVDAFALPEKFILIIPGCAPERPEKRWPAAAFAEVVRHYMAQGVAAVMIGTRVDGDALSALQKLAPGIIDLGARTSLAQIAAIARRAQAVVGNDTGPTHLAGAVGAPTLTLFADTVNPVWSRPRGLNTAYLQGKPLGALTPAQVLQSLGDLAAAR